MYATTPPKGKPNRRADAAPRAPYGDTRDHISSLSFRFSGLFKTEKLAHMLDSLVRVSRRVGWKPTYSPSIPCTKYDSSPTADSSNQLPWKPRKTSYSNLTVDPSVSIPSSTPLRGDLGCSARFEGLTENDSITLPSGYPQGSYLCRLVHTDLKQTPSSQGFSTRT